MPKELIRLPTPAMNREAASRPPCTPKDTTPQLPWGKYFSARAWQASPGRPG